MDRPKQEMRISVCMATYNGEQFVRTQLESILPQLAEEDEIIISDDGSKDNTVEIIKGINDKRIKVFKNDRRPGLVGNFENALERASGKFIFLSDQDDIWLPGKVEIVLELLKNVDLVLSDCEVIDRKGNVLMPSFFVHRGSRPGFWKNVFKNSYMGCCMAFRSNVLNYTLPFPKQVDVHDWWIGLLVESKGKVAFYKHPLIQYVRHGNNASPTGELGYGLAKRLRDRFFLIGNVAKRLLA